MQGPCGLCSSVRFGGDVGRNVVGDDRGRRHQFNLSALVSFLKYHRKIFGVVSRLSALCSEFQCCSKTLCCNNGVRIASDKSSYAIGVESRGWGIICSSN